MYGKEALELVDEFWRIRRVIFGEYEPTMYFILDLPAEEAKQRVDRDTIRVKSEFDQKGLDFYERVRLGFSVFAKSLPSSTIVLDATRDPAAIHDQIYEKMKELCGWE